MNKRDFIKTISLLGQNGRTRGTISALKAEKKVWPVIHEGKHKIFKELYLIFKGNFFFTMFT